MVITPDFGPGNGGSIPSLATKSFNSEDKSYFDCQFNRVVQR